MWTGKHAVDLKSEPHWNWKNKVESSTGLLKHCDASLRIQEMLSVQFTWAVTMTKSSIDSVTPHGSRFCEICFLFGHAQLCVRGVLTNLEIFSIHRSSFFSTTSYLLHPSGFVHNHSINQWRREEKHPTCTLLWPGSGSSYSFVRISSSCHSQPSHLLKVFAFIEKEDFLSNLLISTLDLWQRNTHPKQRHQQQR